MWLTLSQSVFTQQIFSEHLLFVKPRDCVGKSMGSPWQRFLTHSNNMKHLSFVRPWAGSSSSCGGMRHWQHFKLLVKERCLQSNMRNGVIRLTKFIWKFISAGMSGYPTWRSFSKTHLNDRLFCFFFERESTSGGTAEGEVEAGSLLSREPSRGSVPGPRGHDLS